MHEAEPTESQRRRRPPLPTGWWAGRFATPVGARLGLDGAPLGPGEPHGMLRPPEDHRADLDLVRGTLAGEPAHVERFVLRMHCVPSILASQNSRLGRALTTVEIQDLAQDALLTIWKKLDTFAGLSGLETWVYRICCLELLNAIRRQRRRGRAAKLDEELPAAPAVAHAPNLLEYEHVHRGLERIEPEAADVIRLRHFQELSFDEIAARLSIPVNTSKTRYYRGLRKLQEMLRSSEEEPV